MVYEAAQQWSRGGVAEDGGQNVEADEVEGQMEGYKTGRGRLVPRAFVESSHSRSSIFHMVPTGSSVT